MFASGNMFVIELIYFLGILIIFYSYFGYGILIWVLVRLKRLLRKEQEKYPADFFPPVTFIVAAFNEEDFIEKKIRNTLELDYPSGKLHIIFVTDGSTDTTPQKVSEYSEIHLLHTPERRGKVEAMHRAMGFVQTPYVIFSDANTILNRESIRNIVRHYQDPDVGGVAGEKKILPSSSDAAAAGEGLYWKYESFLKKMDWQFFTVVGAAGELFSVRSGLYEYPGKNVLLDDFIISLRVCQKGYRVAYEPEAYAMEYASASIGEEKKRKVRISAGSFQSMFILRQLLNIFRYPKLSFQYISHRILRWTFCPVFLPLVFILNIFLTGIHPFYMLMMVMQVIFYTCALAGWLLAAKKKRISILYAPYYFVFINVSLYLGFLRFLKGKQTVLWEKAERAGTGSREKVSGI